MNGTTPMRGQDNVGGDIEDFHRTLCSIITEAYFVPLLDRWQYQNNQNNQKAYQKMC